MRLFNESENKYYELLSYLINGEGEYTITELDKQLDSSLGCNRDLDIEDLLFERNPENATVFTYDNGKYIPVLPDFLPIRNNNMDLQTIKSLLETSFVDLFLDSATKDKIRKCTTNIETEWNIKDIEIKNQFNNKTLIDAEKYSGILKTIFQAINDRCAIRYDNIIPGKYEYRNEILFPVRVEYSFINNVFRVCAYSEREDRFIKMNLVTMSNVHITSETKGNLEKEYKEYIDLNTKKVVIDVEPIDHVIERCFRIFSYHNRLARYDKENNKYTLEISYLKADEAEVIRDILSLGGYVVVTEPRRIQKEIYKRIVQADALYR